MFRYQVDGFEAYIINPNRRVAKIYFCHNVKNEEDEEEEGDR